MKNKHLIFISIILSVIIISKLFTEINIVKDTANKSSLFLYYNSLFMDTHVAKKACKVNETIKKRNTYQASFLNASSIYEYIISKTSKPGSGFRRIENDFYTMNIPKDLIYATATPEEDKNKVNERQGLPYNVNIFINPNSLDRCGTSLAVKINKSLDVDKLSVKDYMNKLENAILQDDRSMEYERKNKLINDNAVYVATYKIRDSFPDSKESYLQNCSVWIWEAKGRIVEIQFRSCSEFDKYINKIENSVHSLTLKN